MAVLEIKKAGDEVLKKVCAPVTKIDRKIKKLVEDMAETMYDANGVGLAAPQIGLPIRVVVIDIGDGLIELIIPAIIEKEGSEKDTEGCLSIPGVFGEVDRYSKVTVEALNRNGKTVKVAGTGLLARALQHELDHLEGVLFIERANTLYKEKA